MQVAYKGSCVGQEFDFVHFKSVVACEPVDRIACGSVIERKGVGLAQPLIFAVAQAIGEREKNSAFAPFAGFHLLVAAITVQDFLMVEGNAVDVGSHIGHDAKTIARFWVEEVIAGVNSKRMKGDLIQFF